MENSIIKEPKNNLIINDNKNEQNEENLQINEINENIQLKDIITNKDNDEDNITISNIIKKNIFINIDKITLVIMYFVANNEVNVIHLIFVIIFMVQLLTPYYIKKLCEFIIILFQLLLLVEYIMDLLKAYLSDNFKNNILKIQYFLIYNIDNDDSLFKTSIEIFIYVIIYCFYIHYQLYNNELYQKITLDKNINLTNYIETKLYRFPIIQKILYFIGNIIIEIYIWILISSFIFFSCYFEVNLLFAVKLFIFLLSIYQFCIFIQNYKFGEAKMDLKLPRILLIYSGVNTLAVYLYQVFNLEVTRLRDAINNSQNFFVQNLPNIGLTIYKDENLYYNLLPHFFINFISLLYLSEMKRMSNKYKILKDKEDINKNKIIILSNEVEKGDKMQNINNKEDDIFNLDKSNEKEEIKEEEEEKEDEDPLSSAFDKYNSNKRKIIFLNIKYFLSLIIITFTKLYWLFLFVTTCIIYTSQDLSAGIFIYIFIFGITFIFMFYSMMKSLNNFIQKDSYFISKVIRYYLVEKKQHIQNNKMYRSYSFRFLLGYSLLLLFMLYSYGVFDLFQNGCNDTLFRGCEKSNSPIFTKNSEDYIISFSYLLGFYINIKKIGIMSAGWFHLLFSILIAFDVYIQKIENYFTNINVNNRRNYHKLLNENTKLKALISSGEDNFLLNIGKILKNDEDNFLLKDDSFSLYNLSLSRMSNIHEYDELMNNIKNMLEAKHLNIDVRDEELGKRYIIQFLEAFRKASAKKVSLSEKKNKYKIIKAIKEVFEEIIIVLLLCNAITKLNIWSFIYISIAIYLIKVEKTMMKFYYIFCFIIFVIFLQVIIFILNIKKEIDPSPDEDALSIINETLNLPLYKNLTLGFFLGFGVTSSQVKLIWMDFIEVVVIYIYLDYFSYSIYQDVQNKGSSIKGISRINYYNLHLDKKVNQCVKNLSLNRFNKIHDCILYNLDIEIGGFDDFRNKILLNIKNETEPEKISNILITKQNEDLKDNKSEQNKKIERNSIKNKLINLLVPSTKKVNDWTSMSSKIQSKKEKLKLKMQSFLENIYEISYLSFHNIILIIIVIISMMISGIVSLFYITFSLYFLVTSNKMLVGEKYFYPKAIKKILRVAIIVDITIQIIYQTPYFSIKETQNSEDDATSESGEIILLKILNVIGFNKIINYSENTIEIYSHQMILVIAKAISYFFMGIQILIYSSQDFQEKYLSYILTRKENLRRISLMNVFRFNNKRIKTMNKSITLREEMSLSMNYLQNILDTWNNKLSNINTTNIQNSLILFDSNEKNNDDDKLGEEKIFDKVAVKIHIRKWILDKTLINFERWLYKYCVDYSKISNEEKDEYEKNIIQGKIDVKTFIEKVVDYHLDQLELSSYTESEMVEVKKFFDGTRDKQLKKYEEQKRLRRQRLVMQNKTKFVNKLISDLNQKQKLKELEDLEDLLKIDKKKKELKMEEEKFIDLAQPKFKVLEKFIKTELFQKYLKTSFILKCIISDLLTFCSKKFQFLCYLIMIINHISMASLISMVYPISIFCFAIFEYPRPTKSYWNFCIIYSIIIISVKCMLQLDLLVLIFENKNQIGANGKPGNLYLDFLEDLERYKIGLKYTETTFSYEFFKYIIFDALVIIFLLINNYLLINSGLWDKREQDIENIYYANQRVAETKDLKLESNNDIKKLNNTYLISKKDKEYLLKRAKRVTEPKQEPPQLNYLKKITKAKKEMNERDSLKEKNIIKNEDKKNENKKNKEKQKVKEKEKKDEKKIQSDYVTVDSFTEHNKKYFERLFPKIRNEKPGADFYLFYTISMISIIIFIIIFYTTMIQDVTFNALSQETNQFNSSMVIFLIIHIVFLFYDRIIYINQNRNNIKYNYIIYNKARKEPLSEERFNYMKTEISMKYNDTKRENFIIPSDYAEKLRKDYNIVYIQNEEFNKPLLQKYILHIFIVLLSHGFIFFYSPMKGNKNINQKIYCEKEDDACNDFDKNWTLIGFYIIYLFYFLFSGLQIKFGFYDMKRKSLLKSGNSSLNGTINSVFRNIPFMYEIKLAIDWTFTSTCLDIFQWNKFESVYDTVYTTYCAMNAKNVSLIGQKIGKFWKIGMGGTLSFGLIIVLIIPILLFSSLNPTNESNNLTGASLTVELSFLYNNGLNVNYTLFQNTKPESIKDFSENDWETYKYNISASTKNFPLEQIQKVQFSKTSDRNWGLAKPQIQKLISMLDYSDSSEDKKDNEESNKNEISEIQLIIDYKFQRNLPVEAKITGQRKGTVIYNRKNDQNITNTSEIGKIRRAISECYNETIVFHKFYLAPIRLTANVNSREIEDEKFEIYDAFLEFTGCKNISDDINNYDDLNNNNSYHSYLESYFNFGNDKEKQGLFFHVFSDKVSTTTSGYSVMGFYFSFILLVGTYVRNFFAGQPSKITLTEMPCCQEIINLCEGIKISRYSFDFEQEEKLYYILMELMRSPDYLKYLTESSMEQFNKRKKLTDDNKETNFIFK